MLALLQLLLLKRATKQRVAVLIHPIGEVLTGHADAGTLPALKLCVVDKSPFLHTASFVVRMYYSDAGGIVNAPLLRIVLRI